MKVISADFLQEELERPGYFLKAILNEHGVAFFSRKTEHRTVKFDGMSYEDDYKGNALAAIITDGRIEMRNHRDYSSGRVGLIMSSLRERPELQCIRNFSVQYRGEMLK